MRVNSAHITLVKNGNAALQRPINSRDTNYEGNRHSHRPTGFSKNCGTTKLVCFPKQNALLSSCEKTLAEGTTSFVGTSFFINVSITFTAVLC